MKKILIFLFLFVILLPQTVLAKEENLEVKITQIISQKNNYQKLKAVVEKGTLKNKTVVLENGSLPTVYTPIYQVGHRLSVTYTKNSKGEEMFIIRDFIRRDILLLLCLIFIAVTFFVMKKNALSSFLSLAFSFVMIFYSIIPNILSGADPVLTVLLCSLFIIPVTFFLAHGVNKKTFAAVAGTFIALVVTGILSAVFVYLTKLSGFSSEEASFIQLMNQKTLNLRGILLAGMIIGTLGVLDDVTVSQAAVTFELKKANKLLTQKELYKKAMAVGQDHIGSMINTLILVYTGASLPLLLLFVKNPHPFSEIINYEIIAEEVIRTLVGSIGLVLSVPITTLIASYSSQER